MTNFEEKTTEGTQKKEDYLSLLPGKSLGKKGQWHWKIESLSQVRIDEDYSHTQRRRWHPTPVLLPGKSHGRKSLVGCSPLGHEESDTTERHHFHFSLSYIGEGNGNPLQCSCLENPRDGRAWWATIYGVAQSRTRLKRLTSSSSILTLERPKTTCPWLSVHGVAKSQTRLSNFTSLLTIKREVIGEKPNQFHSVFCVT